MKYLSGNPLFQEIKLARRRYLFSLVNGFLALFLLIAEPISAQQSSISTNNFDNKKDTALGQLVSDEIIVTKANLEKKKLVKVGVLSIRDMDTTKQQWQATIDYLNQEIPEYQFELVPFRLDDVNQLVKNQVIDFALVNPGLYVALESLYDARHISTLESLRLGNAATHFGAVIIRRRDRQDIQVLEDLKGKTFMAVSELAFGGWQMAWATLLEAGIKPYQDLKEIKFGEGNHDDVVKAVLNGNVDAGTVRTDTLEKMEQEGKISLRNLEILNSQNQIHTKFPFALSTKLYPEWAFASFPNTNSDLSKSVSMVLMNMPASHQAAINGKYEGWATPANYQPVHTTLKKLNVSPYEDWGKITWSQALYKYRYWIICSGLGLFILLVSLIRLKQKEARLIKIQTELKDSQRFLQLVMNTLPMSIFWKDIDLCYLGTNQKFSKDAGFEDSEMIIGKNDYDMPWKTEEADFYRQCDLRVITSNKAEIGIIEPQLNAEGNETWLETNKVPLHDQNGNIVGILGTYQDITIRKEAEFTLQRSKEELEQRVKERTLELEKAKEAAEVASKAKSEFLSCMSHELRTPLNGVLGYAQILRRNHDLSPQQRKGINIIFDSGKHLLTLINDILDLSKIEAGKLELSPTDVHLEIFLSGVEGIVRMRALTKNIEFVYQSLTHLPQGIVADEKRLRQVLLNLLGNAIKFTDIGQVAFNVSAMPVNTEQETGNEHQAGAKKLGFQTFRFEIVDTGIGISPEQQKSIFQAFEQVGDKKRQAEGTGLGLAISKRFVDLMGGTLEVQSELGKGSTFWFEIVLPVIDSVKNSKQLVQQKNILGYKGEQRKLLVVDDKLENRQLLKSMLSPLGFEIILGEDGQQAIELAQQTNPDCILTDIVMPNKNGFEAVTEIRTIPELVDVPIIAISASVTVEEKQKSIDVGCNHFLPKPINEIKLLTVIAQLLNLDWLYDEPANLSANTSDSSNLKPLVMPPAEELETLYELAMLGSMRKIRDRANYLEELDSQYAPLATELKNLAQGFQEKAIIDLIEKHL